MKIAVIEDNQDFRELLRQVFLDYSWSVDFFFNPSEFGKANLDSFDVIIADVILPTINGRDLIKSVAKKSSAELFLMSASSNNFSDDDIHNERITGLIDKMDVNNIVDQLKYIDVKMRINKAIQQENEKLNDIVYNGYRLEIKDGIVVFGIKDVLRQETRNAIQLKIESRNIKKGIMYFYCSGIVHSAVLGELPRFYKIFKERKGELIFWDNSEDHSLKKQLEVCNLDKLFKIFDNLDEAKNLLKALV